MGWRPFDEGGAAFGTILTAPGCGAKFPELDAMKLAAVFWLSASLASAAAARAAQGPDLPLAAVEEAARRDSNDAEALYALGVAYARAGRDADAKRMFLETVRVDPQHALGYVALAEYYHSSLIIASDPTRPGRLRVLPSSKADSAGIFLGRVFQLNPFIEIHHPGINELPGYWRGTLQQALRHFHEGKLPQALEEFGTVIQRTEEPGHPEKIPSIALQYHMLAALRIARFDDAIRDGQLMLDVALRLAQITDTAHGVLQQLQAIAGALVNERRYILAEANRAAGNGSEAERLYLQVLETDLSYYMAHARLAGMYEMERRWTEAVSERRRAVDASPDDPSLVFDLGLTLANAGLLSEADSTLRRAAAANPREVRAMYVLGIVNVGLGRPGEARAAFNTFLSLAPSRYATMIADARQRLVSLQ
jgi:tetratricopeptide (TPR) repeat protein